MPPTDPIETATTNVLTKKQPRFYNPSPHHVYVTTPTGKEIILQPKAYEGHMEKGVNTHFFVEGEHYRQFVRPHGALVEEVSAVATMFPNTAASDPTSAALRGLPLSQHAHEGITQATSRQVIANLIRAQFRTAISFTPDVMERGVDYVIALMQPGQPQTPVPREWLPYEAELRVAANAPALAPPRTMADDEQDNEALHEDQFVAGDDEGDDTVAGGQKPDGIPPILDPDNPPVSNPDEGTGTGPAAADEGAYTSPVQNRSPRTQVDKLSKAAKEALATNAKAKVAAAKQTKGAGRR